MKNGIICLVIFTLIVLSCSRPKHQNKLVLDENKYWDSLCLAETERAEVDIRNGKLVHTHFFGMVETYNSDEEMNELLSQFKIENAMAGFLCTAPVETQSCYEGRMRSEIERRFGENFIDSLRGVAEVKYVQNNIDKIFPFQECDRESRYPGANSYGDFFDKYEEDFFGDFEYPEDYVVRKKSDEYYSYMNVGFVLYKDGSISKLETQIRLQKEENYKFAHYFMKSVEEFVQNVKWKPATASGIPVNSEMNLYFKLK